MTTKLKGANSTYTTREVAAIFGYTEGSWRNMLNMGYAPVRPLNEAEQAAKRRPHTYSKALVDFVAGALKQAEELKASMEKYRQASELIELIEYDLYVDRTTGIVYSAPVAAVEAAKAGTQVAA